MNSSFEDYKRFPLGMPMSGTVADPESLGYVYIIGFSERGIVKIGSAASVATRIVELQCGNPFRLKLRAAVSIYSHNPISVEMAAHKLAKEWRIRGEWFRLEDDEALRIVLKAARNLKVKHGAYAVSCEAAMGPQGKTADDERRRRLRIKLGMDENDMLTDCAN